MTEKYTQVDITCMLSSVCLIQNINDYFVQPLSEGQYMQKYWHAVGVAAVSCRQYVADASLWAVAIDNGAFNQNLNFLTAFVWFYGELNILNTDRSCAVWHAKEQKIIVCNNKY